MARRPISDEEKENVIQFLKSKKITEEIIQQMSFSVSSKNNIIIKVGNDQVVLLKNDGSYKFNNNITTPEIWTAVSMSAKECEEMRLLHPQCGLINKMECRKLSKGIMFALKPQKDIPYKLEEAFTVKGRNKERIINNFISKNLIKGPSEKICKEAYGILEDKVNSLAETYKSLKISKFDITSENISFLGNGFIPKKMKCNIEAESINFSYEEIMLRYDITGGSFCLSESYSEMLDKLKLCKTAVKAVIELKNEFKKNKNVKCETDFDFSVPSAVLTVKYSNFKQKYEVHEETAEEDAEAVRTSYIKDIEENDKITEEQNKEKEKQIMESPACGSLVAECIYSIVENNMKAYKGISRTALVKKVRGLYESKYVDGNYPGKYKLISENDVSGMVDLLIKYQILDTRYVKGEYTDYDKIITGDENRKKFIFMRRQPDSFVSYTDQDWMYELNNPSSKWNDKNIVSLLYRIPVYCAEPDLFVKYFESAPDDVKEYVRIMGKLGGTQIKKICKAVCAGFKKEEKDAGEALEAKGE